MIQPMSTEAEFDLFYDDPLTPLLIGSFDEFAAAQAAMRDKASRVPGRYFIWSHEEEEVLAQLDTDSPPHAIQ